MSEFNTASKKFWSPTIRQLVPYTPGEQPKLNNLVKLNTNECPFPPSPKVAEAISAILENDADLLRLYPDPESSQLKQVVADYHGLSIHQVFVGNGSDEVLAHIFMAFFKQNKPLIYPNITYSFYPVYADLYHIDTQTIALTDDFSIDLLNYPTQNGGVIFANPNAPTGKLLSLETIEAFLQKNTESVVVVDEAYIDFGGESAIALIQRYDNLIVVHTTSKSRSLAGLRVGFAFAQAHLIEALNCVKNSFNSYPIDRLAQAGVIASYQDNDYFENVCKRMIALREELVSGLIQFGFDVLPSTANFVFVKHPNYDASQIASFLREEGIIVRHFKQPLIEQYLRITVGTTQMHQCLFERLNLFKI